MAEDTRNREPHLVFFPALDYLHITLFAAAFELYHVSRKRKQSDKTDYSSAALGAAVCDCCLFRINDHLRKILSQVCSLHIMQTNSMVYSYILWLPHCGSHINIVNYRKNYPLLETRLYMKSSSCITLFFASLYHLSMSSATTPARASACQASRSCASKRTAT